MRRLTPLALVATLAAAATLAGCGGTDGATPGPTIPWESTVTPIPVPTPTPKPTFVPGGSATDNRDYFKWVLDEYAITHGMGTSEALVASLIEAGFEAGLMEVTSDSTAIGLTASAIDVSVRVDHECLVGSIRTESVIVRVVPVLGTGRCLVGETEPIG